MRGFELNNGLKCRLALKCQPVFLCINLENKPILKKTKKEMYKRDAPEDYLCPLCFVGKDQFEEQ